MDIHTCMQTCVLGYGPRVGLHVHMYECTKIEDTHTYTHGCALQPAATYVCLSCYSHINQEDVVYDCVCRRMFDTVVNRCTYCCWFLWKWIYLELGYYKRKSYRANTTPVVSTQACVEREDGRALGLSLPLSPSSPISLVCVAWRIAIVYLHEN